MGLRDLRRCPAFGHRREGRGVHRHFRTRHGSTSVARPAPVSSLESETDTDDHEAPPTRPRPHHGLGARRATPRHAARFQVPRDSRRNAEVGAAELLPMSDQSSKVQNLRPSTFGPLQSPLTPPRPARRADSDESKRSAPARAKTCKSPRKYPSNLPAVAGFP